jgi:hypothetical protein
MPPHHPAILPRWARRTSSLDALLPVLYLRGVARGDFQEALAALLGKEAPNLSPLAIARLRDRWQADYARWQRRDLSARHYVYLWADEIYLQARMEPQAECMLVLIGTTPEERKELVGFRVGMRESAQSGRELLVELQGTWPGDRTAAGHRRRRPGLLEGARCGFPDHLAPALLDAQGGQCLGQAAEIRPARGEAGSARGLAGAGSCHRRDGDRHLRREIRGQVREGGQLPTQGAQHNEGYLNKPQFAIVPNRWLHTLSNRECA